MLLLKNILNIEDYMWRVKTAFIVVIIIFLNSCMQQGLETKSKKYAFIAKERDQSFHEFLMTGVRKEMAKLHVDVDFMAAKNQSDIESQKKFVQNIIDSKNYDGVMLCPNDSKALLPDVQKLNDAGIPFLIIDTALDDSVITKNFQKNCGYVGTNNLEVGRMAMRFIADKLDEGQILMVRGVHEHRSSLDRENGFLEEMNKKTGFKTIGFLDGEWKVKETYAALAEFMEHSSQVPDAVFAYNDYMALGISQYYEEHPKLKKPIIIGVDGTVVGQRGLLEGKIEAIVVQTAELMGSDGLRRLDACLSNSSIQELELFTPVTLLTATTALKRLEK